MMLRLMIMRYSLVLWHIFGGGCHGYPWTPFILTLVGCAFITFVEYTFIDISVYVILYANEPSLTSIHPLNLWSADYITMTFPLYFMYSPLTPSSFHKFNRIFHFIQGAYTCDILLNHPFFTVSHFIPKRGVTHFMNSPYTIGVS